MNIEQLEKILKPYWAKGWDGYCRFDSGWSDLVYELHNKITEIEPNYKLNQIKEKFGILRFYCEFDDYFLPENSDKRNAIDTLVEEYQKYSGSKCEICGDPGTMHYKKRWMKTLCPVCAEKELYVKRISMD